MNGGLGSRKTEIYPAVPEKAFVSKIAQGAHTLFQIFELLILKPLAHASFHY